MKPLSWSLAATLFVATLAGSEIDSGVDPLRHYRFLSGFDTGAPTSNAGVLGGGLDLSGVGWSLGDTRLNVALLSPKHFAIAGHVLRPGGEKIAFLNADGMLKQYTIAGAGTSGYTIGHYNGFASDVAIGELVETVATADHLKIYSTLKAGPLPATFPADPATDPTLSFYMGKSVVALGQNEAGNPRGGKVSRDTILSATTYSFAGPPSSVGYAWQSSPTTPDSGRLVGGDSGSPAFLQYGGELYFLGSNSGISDPAGPMQFNVGGLLPWYVDDFNASIAGTGFQLSVFTPVPEPGSMGLVFAAAAAAWTVRRRAPRTAPRRPPAAPNAGR